MGSKRFGQVRFRAISGDHAGAAIQHLHADIGSGEVVIELLSGGGVRLSSAHGTPIRGKITERELKVVLATAADNHEELEQLWKAGQV
ncbi:MAG: DUF4160 domain-containing protein [Candidatus Eremiobacteraeota bacterium]|nr:DUF4160 domain-containing protein [Candidatus Eremiobacteraeota bacterium]